MMKKCWQERIQCNIFCDCVCRLEDYIPYRQSRKLENRKVYRLSFMNTPWNSGEGLVKKINRDGVLKLMELEHTKANVCTDIFTSAFLLSLLR